MSSKWRFVNQAKAKARAQVAAQSSAQSSAGAMSLPPAGPRPEHASLTEIKAALQGGSLRMMLGLGAELSLHELADSLETAAGLKRANDAMFFYAQAQLIGTTTLSPKSRLIVDGIGKLLKLARSYSTAFPHASASSAQASAQAPVLAPELSVEDVGKFGVTNGDAIIADGSGLIYISEVGNCIKIGKFRIRHAKGRKCANDRYGNREKLPNHPPELNGMTGKDLRFVVAVNCGLVSDRDLKDMEAHMHSKVVGLSSHREWHSASSKGLALKLLRQLSSDIEGVVPVVNEPGVSLASSVAAPEGVDDMEVEVPAVPVAAPEVVEDLEVEIPAIPVAAPEGVKEMEVEIPAVANEMEVDVPAVAVAAPEVVKEMVEVPAVPVIGFRAELLNRGITVIKTQGTDIDISDDELQRLVENIFIIAAKSSLDEDNVARLSGDIGLLRVDLAENFFRGCDSFIEQVHINMLDFDEATESEEVFNARRKLAEDRALEKKLMGGSELAKDRSLDEELTGGSELALVSSLDEELTGGSELAVDPSVEQESTGGSSGSGLLGASNLSNILKELRNGQTQKGVALKPHQRQEKLEKVKAHYQVSLAKFYFFGFVSIS